MIKLLFKFVIPLAVFLTIGLVGYNYFFGTPAEQENSRQIMAKVKGLGSDVVSLLRSEKQKFGEGKYDAAVDKIGSSLTYLKQKVGFMPNNGNYLDQINMLEWEREQLIQQLNAMNQNARFASGPANPSGIADYSQAEEQIHARLNELARQTEELGMRIGMQ